MHLGEAVKLPREDRYNALLQLKDRAETNATKRVH
jgi:hypothetical protein